MRNNKCELHNEKFITTWNDGKRICRKCRNERTYNHRRNCKKKLVDLFGGKCELCGYCKSIRSLQFHHINPAKKEFALGHWTTTLSFEKMLVEAQKCMLVCGNCHGEIEDGVTVVSAKLLDRTVINQKLQEQKRAFVAKKKRKVHNKVCKKCGDEFIGSFKKQIYCSIVCANKSRYNHKELSKEDLEKLLWEKPTTHIAKDFGVSDNAVAKWAKNYGLKKPPRGYWTKHATSI